MNQKSGPEGPVAYLIGLPHATKAQATSAAHSTSKQTTAHASNDSATRREAKHVSCVGQPRNRHQRKKKAEENQVSPSNLPRRNQADNNDNSDVPQRSYDLDDDDKNLFFL